MRVAFAIVFLCLLFTVSFNLSAQKAKLVIQSGMGNVSAVAYSPDGKFVATGGADSRIILWDVKSKKQLKTFIAEDYVSKIEFSSNGQFIASKSTVWNVKSGKKILQLDCYQLNLSSCGNFATTNSRTNIKIWDLHQGKAIFTYKPDPDNFHATVSATKKYLILSGEDKIIKLINIKTGLLEKTLVGHRNETVFSSTNEDESLLVSCGADSSTIIWDLASGKILQEIKGDDIYMGSAVFSKDGNFVIASAQNDGLKHHTYIWSIKENILKGYVPGKFHSFNQLQNKLITLDTFTYRVIELEKFSVERWFSFGKKLANSAISPDWNIGLIGPAFDNEEIRLVNLNTFKQIAELKGFAYYASTVDIHPSSNAILLSGFKIWTWDLSNGGNRIFQNENATYDTKFPEILEYTRDGKNITIGFDRKIIGTDLDFTPTDLSIVKTEGGGYRNVELNATGKILAASSQEPSVELWDLSTQQMIKEVKGWHIDSDKSGKFFASVDLITKGVMVYNFAGSQVAFLPTLTEGTSVKFTLDGKKIISAAGKGVYVWDLATKVLVKKINNSCNMWSAALSADNKRIATVDWEGNFKLWDYATGALITTQAAHLGFARKVVVSPDNKYMITTGDDGLVQFWNALTGKKILTLYNLANENWVALTPDGYFFGSKASNEGLHYVDDSLKIFTFDQFDLQYNRPDIILERLGYASPELIKGYRSAWEKRVRRMGYDPANFQNDLTFNAPSVSLVNEALEFTNSSSRNFSFEINASDAKFNLERLHVEVNGVPLYGMKGSLIDKTLQLNKTISLDLCQGKNIIKVSVVNEKGIESLKQKMEVNYEVSSPSKPNLYILAIGVSNFTTPTMNLNYAAKDASDFVSTLSSQNSKYGKIEVLKFVNEQATRDNVLGVKEKLRATNVDDEVVVFVASHGLLDAQLDYYLAMHNTNFQTPSENGLKYEDLEALIDGIPARKKTMFLDACHSGEIDKEEVVATNATTTETSKGNQDLVFRGFTSVQNKEGVGLKNSFELMKSLFSDLKRGTGAVVISSASGKEYAIESSQWKNGVFTYTLLEGIKSGNADHDKNSKISISELRNYVSKRVQELTKGKQNLTSRSENIELEYHIW